MSVADHETFLSALGRHATAVEKAFAPLLDTAPLADEIARPMRLVAAMRHASLGGGKRLRPFLLIESAALFGVTPAAALSAALALECVHCYSLVHDDLPAMDNSDLRRGLPATHKAFDEATAILAGDALLTLAFDVITRDDVHPRAEVRLALTRLLARTSGLGGMAGGQMLDLEGEGRFGAAAPPDIARLQAMKTGALLRFACVAGALLGEAGETDTEALNRYGRAFGEAFQIADDLLDVEGNAAQLGKTTGQDAALGKSTFVSTLGLDGARARLAQRLADAEAALAPFGARAALLRAAARYVAERKH